MAGVNTEDLFTDEERRSLTRWAIECAERALPLFEARNPGDTRPREAIEASRAFANGGKRTKRIRTAAWASQAASSETTDPIAARAARVAMGAAGAAYIHGIHSVHQVRHVLAPAVLMALAFEGRDGNDRSVGETEIGWAIGQATPEVRAVLQKLPVPVFAQTRNGILSRLLYEGLIATPPAGDAC